MRIRQICCIQGCGGKMVGKGYCMKHYLKVKRGLDPNEPTTKDYRPSIIDGEIARIPIGLNAKNGYTIVDKEFAYLDKYKWSLSGNGYPMSNSEGGIYIHHKIIGKHKGKVVDHIDMNKYNNTKNNLRIVGQSINILNCNRKLLTNPYRGVYYIKDDNYYRAEITYGNIKISKDGFKTADEAHEHRLWLLKEHDIYKYLPLNHN